MGSRHARTGPTLVISPASRASAEAARWLRSQLDWEATLDALRIRNATGDSPILERPEAA